ncbi:MAG: patatin-like phospholipase family protein [Gemmatirosa sp.]
MPSALTLRAGPAALALVRERGLRAEDIDVVPGASGGAKWLALAGLDRYLFGEFLQQPRTRPLHLIGSSIGSWRMACLAQRDPVAALARGHHAYIYEQRYSARPSTREVTEVLTRALDLLLGETGVDEILAHPWARLHVITAEGRGLAASERRLLLMAGLALVAAGNLLARRALALQMRRCIFHSAGDETPFAHLSDLPTTHVPLTRENLRAALLASGSIPLLLEGVKIPGTPSGVHWDGGVLDYHLDLDFGAGDGLVLYPHFYAHVVPGWFDRGLRWRLARGANFRRALLVAPSDAFVAALPGSKIPDRRDFHGMPETERMRRWQAVVDASARLGDELRTLIETGRIAEAVRPW